MLYKFEIPYKILEENTNANEEDREYKNLKMIEFNWKKELFIAVYTSEDE